MHGSRAAEGGPAAACWGAAAWRDDDRALGRARKAKKIADDLVDAAHLVDNVFKPAALDIIEIGTFANQFGRCLDDAKRVADLMRQPRRNFAKRRQALPSQQLDFHLAEPLEFLGHRIESGSELAELKRIPP